ncbi:MAG: hypothetical protein DI570_07935 [Phenylobacterium zucineum]|nr:MAG: hypothetical protein DI570_07935 [Phenylobacterium zucineum]
MDLTVLGQPPPRRDGEIRACVMVRDEVVRLPSFLRHHRALGVDRFIVVDDGSTDGTVELLAAQPDVHVVRSSADFAARHQGVDWINHVLDAFCDGCWTLTLDADELFLFPSHERVSLREACDLFDRAGAEGVMALMIDMYGAGDVSTAVHDPQASLIDTCPYFDPGPYRAVRTGLFPHVQFHGGPRMRMFDFSPYQERPPVLTKVPLVKWARGRRYLLSTHAVTPLRLYPMLAGLLHFKFLSDFHDRVALGVATGRHYGGSSEYRAYRDVLERGRGLRLRDDHSVRFTGADQLVRLELMYADAAFDALAAGEAVQA